MANKSCFFTGHRNVGFDPLLIMKTGHIINDLIKDGVTDFYAGGAVGWDMICEELVISLKKQYPHIKLHLVLPYPPDEKTAKWNIKQKAEFQGILNVADDVEILSETYYNGCMKKRSNGGTVQTMRMSKKLGIDVVNLF